MYEPVLPRVRSLFLLLTNGSVLQFKKIHHSGKRRIENYLITERNLIAWPEQFFSLFTNRKTRDRIEFGRKRASA